MAQGYGGPSRARGRLSPGSGGKDSGSAIGSCLAMRKSKLAKKVRGVVVGQIDLKSRQVELPVNHGLLTSRRRGD